MAVDTSPKKLLDYVNLYPTLGDLQKQFGNQGFAVARAIVQYLSVLQQPGINQPQEYKLVKSWALTNGFINNKYASVDVVLEEDINQALLDITQKEVLVAETEAIKTLQNYQDSQNRQANQDKQTLELKTAANLSLREQLKLMLDPQKEAKEKLLDKALDTKTEDKITRLVQEGLKAGNTPDEAVAQALDLTARTNSRLNTVLEEGVRRQIEQNGFLTPEKARTKAIKEAAQQVVASPAATSMPASMPVDQQLAVTYLRQAGYSQQQALEKTKTYYDQQQTKTLSDAEVLDITLKDKVSEEQLGSLKKLSGKELAEGITKLGVDASAAQAITEAVTLARTAATPTDTNNQTRQVNPLVTKAKIVAAVVNQNPKQPISEQVMEAIDKAASQSSPRQQAKTLLDNKVPLDRTQINAILRHSPQEPVGITPAQKPAVTAEIGSQINQIEPTVDSNAIKTATTHLTNNLTTTAVNPDHPSRISSYAQAAAQASTDLGIPLTQATQVVTTTNPIITTQIQTNTNHQAVIDTRQNLLTGVFNPQERLQLEGLTTTQIQERVTAKLADNPQAATTINQALEHLDTQLFQYQPKSDQVVTLEEKTRKAAYLATASQKAQQQGTSLTNEDLKVIDQLAKANTPNQAQNILSQSGSSLITTQFVEATHQQTQTTLTKLLPDTPVEKQASVNSTLDKHQINTSSESGKKLVQSVSGAVGVDEVRSAIKTYVSETNATIDTAGMERLVSDLTKPTTPTITNQAVAQTLVDQHLPIASVPSEVRQETIRIITTQPSTEQSQQIEALFASHPEVHKAIEASGGYQTLIDKYHATSNSLARVSEVINDPNLNHDAKVEAIKNLATQEDAVAVLTAVKSLETPSVGQELTNTNRQVILASPGFINAKAALELNLEQAAAASVSVFSSIELGNGKTLKLSVDSVVMASILVGETPEQTVDRMGGLLSDTSAAGYLDRTAAIQSITDMRAELFGDINTFVSSDLVAGGGPNPALLAFLPGTNNPQANQQFWDLLNQVPTDAQGNLIEGGVLASYFKMVGAYQRPANSLPADQPLPPYLNRAFALVGDSQYSFPDSLIISNSKYLQLLDSYAANPNSNYSFVVVWQTVGVGGATTPSLAILPSASGGDGESASSWLPPSIGNIGSGQVGGSSVGGQGTTQQPTTSQDSPQQPSYKKGFSLRDKLNGGIKNLGSKFNRLLKGAPGKLFDKAKSHLKKLLSKLTTNLIKELLKKVILALVAKAAVIIVIVVVIVVLLVIIIMMGSYMTPATPPEQRNDLVRVEKTVAWFNNQDTDDFYRAFDPTPNGPTLIELWQTRQPEKIGAEIYYDNPDGEDTFTDLPHYDFIYRVDIYLGSNTTGSVEIIPSNWIQDALTVSPADLQTGTCEPFCGGSSLSIVPFDENGVQTTTLSQAGTTHLIAFYPVSIVNRNNASLGLITNQLDQVIDALIENNVRIYMDTDPGNPGGGETEIYADNSAKIIIGDPVLSGGCWPTTGTITQGPFTEPGTGTTHSVIDAIDIYANSEGGPNAPVYSNFGGIIQFFDEDNVWSGLPIYGKMGLLRASNGKTLLFGHMSRFASEFSAGNSYSIQAGQQIGYMGNSGSGLPGSGGRIVNFSEHLHYEIVGNFSRISQMPDILPENLITDSSNRRVPGTQNVSSETCESSSEEGEEVGQIACYSIQNGSQDWTDFELASVQTEVSALMALPNVEEALCGDGQTIPIIREDFDPNLTGEGCNYDGSGEAGAEWTGMTLHVCDKLFDEPSTFGVYSIWHESGHTFQKKHSSIWMSTFPNFVNTSGYLPSYPLGQTYHEDFAESFGACLYNQNYSPGSLNFRGITMSYNQYRDHCEAINQTLESVN